MHRIGAHVSVGKGLLSALDQANAMKANCLQIFASPPRSFVGSKFKDSDCSEFKAKLKKLAIQPIFIHATYLINLASDKQSLLQSSINSLIDDLYIASKIGALGSIVHIGSHKGKGLIDVLPVITAAISQVLIKTPPVTKLYLEIASGGKGKIGANFEELATVINQVNSQRLGVCLDTAHMFAAGYKFDSPAAVNQLVKVIDKTVGWHRVECIHANDSKAEFASGKDRHENIGEGKIGLEPFRLLLNHPQFGQLPFILEVPGFGKKKGPDQDNIQILKRLINS